MGRFKITSLNPERVALENIFIATESLTFCKDTSAKIVGGNSVLQNLIASGEIRAEKRSQSQNGKWWCNAADVLRHVANKRH